MASHPEMCELMSKSICSACFWTMKSTTQRRSEYMLLRPFGLDFGCADFGIPARRRGRGLGVPMLLLSWWMAISRGAVAFLILRSAYGGVRWVPCAEYVFFRSRKMCFDVMDEIFSAAERYRCHLSGWADGIHRRQAGFPGLLEKKYAHKMSLEFPASNARLL